MSGFGDRIFGGFKLVTAEEIALFRAKVSRSASVASGMFPASVVGAVHRFAVARRLLQLKRRLGKAITPVKAKLAKNRNDLQVDNHIFQQFELDKKDG